jgi:hypothetical protein
MIDQISTLGFHFLAIYILAQGLSGTATMLATISVNDASDYGVISFFLLTGPVTADVVLWVLSKPLGRFIGKGLKSESPAYNEAGILIAGTALIGVLIIAFGIPDLTRALISLSEAQQFSTMSKTTIYADFYAAVIQLLFGMALVVGKARIGKLLRMVRYGGTSA